ALAHCSYPSVGHSSGDATYAPSDSAVEPLTVHKAPTTAPTVIELPGAGDPPAPAAVPLGTSVQDDATVGGAVAGVPAPTGTVTYHFFMGATEVGTGETVPLGPDSPPTAPLAARPYPHVAHL